jgi:hypothetical protein
LFGLVAWTPDEQAKDSCFNNAAAGAASAAAAARLLDRFARSMTMMMMVSNQSISTARTQASKQAKGACD